MSVINIASENILTFKRIKNDACIGYEIFVKEYTSNGVKEYLLDVIKNPKISLDIPSKIKLKNNKKKRWQLEDDVVGIGTSSISVFVNKVQLNTMQYTFNPNLKLLTIHIDIMETDDIEIECKLDRIKYIHNTTNKCEYNIVPKFNKTHTIGTHSKL